MLTWETVESLASEAGISRKTVRIWRERGVAAKARIALYAAAKDRNIEFDIREFDDLPLSRARAA